MGNLKCLIAIASFTVPLPLAWITVVSLQIFSKQFFRIFYLPRDVRLCSDWGSLYPMSLTTVI